MFRTFKPKGDRVKAVQVSAETVEEIVATFMGRTFTQWISETDERVLCGVDIPTLDGVKRVELGVWLIRNTDNTLTFLSDEDFQKRYEPARVVAGSE